MAYLKRTYILTNIKLHLMCTFVHRITWGNFILSANLWNLNSNGTGFKTNISQSSKLFDDLIFQIYGNKSCESFMDGIFSTTHSNMAVFRLNEKSIESIYFGFPFRTWNTCAPNTHNYTNESINTLQKYTKIRNMHYNHHTERSPQTNSLTCR